MSDVNLRFKLKPDEIQKWPEYEYEVLEMALDGIVKLYRLRPIMARYLVDENDQPLTSAAALKQLGEIPIGEWPVVVRQFMMGIKDAAIPKASGSPSNSISEAPSPTPAPSPTGSTL